MKHSFINLLRKDEAVEKTGGFSAEEKAELQSSFTLVEKNLGTKLTDETKTAVETAVKPLNQEITSLKDQIKVIKDAADKNQPVIDGVVVNKDKKPFEKEPITFRDAIANAIMESQDQVMKFAKKETKNLILEIKGNTNIEQKVVGDMTTGNVTSGTRYGQIFAPRIIQQPYRRVHVRDLIPTAAAGQGNSFTFMKEATTGEGEIAAVAETATKPQFDLDLIEDTVLFEIIAGWMRVTRKAMNNIPGFIAWIQQRLPEKLLRVEDEYILYGTGVTPQIKGIGTAGNFTAATTTSTNIEDALIDALSQLEDTNERYATGIVVRPRVYYNFFKNKATGGSEEYDLPKNYIFVNGVLYISGIPVVPTTAVHSGDYFVGDWMEGAQLLIQEGMRLEFFEQDSTNVRENKVTVRIEETAALPVFGASFFIKGNDATES